MTGTYENFRFNLEHSTIRSVGLISELLFGYRKRFVIRASVRYGRGRKSCSPDRVAREAEEGRGEISEGAAPPEHVEGAMLPLLYRSTRILSIFALTYRPSVVLKESTALYPPLATCPVSF